MKSSDSGGYGSSSYGRQNQQRIDLLEARLQAIERSDKRQWARLRLQQKTTAGCVVAIALGALLYFTTGSIDPDDKELFERLAIAAITAGVSGAGLSPLLEGNGSSED